MKKIALYNPYLYTKGGGEKVCLALAESLHKDLGCEVYLVIHEKLNLDELASYFKLDLTGIKTTVVNFDTFLMRLARRLPLPGRIKNIINDKKVATAIKRGKFDMFINNCYQSNLPSPIRPGVYMCMFPQQLDKYAPGTSTIKKVYVWLARKLSRLVLHPVHKSPIDTYDLITANSAYTQSFIQSLWRKDSSILYPICEDMNDPNVTKKEKIILHVGRFFANDGESHHKRQDILLETFTKLTDLQKDGWQLHMAGSVAEDVGGLKYILRLMEDARGLPIFFHFNCSFPELRKLYNQATIYWHATGYGSDPLKHPEKQEHFGISTVEAMSAGTIPIVINSAGQKESVIQAQNGFLWNTLQQLVDYTDTVASMGKTEQVQLAKCAIKSARQFNTHAFRKNVRAIFSDFVS